MSTVPMALKQGPEAFQLVEASSTSPTVVNGRPVHNALLPPPAAAVQ